MTEPRHCDTYIDDPGAPECLQNFLYFHRMPAVQKNEHDRTWWPIIYATLRVEVPPDIEWGRARMVVGQRVALTMASRFGDVGITAILKDPPGYRARVAVEDLTDFSVLP